MGGKTIKGKLTATIILIVTVAQAVIAAVITGMAWSRLQEKQESELSLQAANYAEEINTWMETEIMLVEGVIRGVESVGDLSQESLQAVVDTYYMGRNELLNLYIGTSDSRFVRANRNSEIPAGYDPVTRGWYQQAKNQGRTVVTDPYWDVLTNQMCFTISSPIVMNGRLEGVVAVDMKLDAVTGLMKGINYDQGVYGFLVDASGNYITHQNEAFEPGKDSATRVTDVMPKLEVAVSKGMGDVVKAADYNGSTCYFSIQRIEGSGWKLGVVIPETTLTGPIRIMVILSVLIVIVAVVLAAGIMARIIGRIMAPIQTLKQFASGDFSENVVTEKKIPAQYKDEAHQINESTANVKRQIRGIILQTKDDAENIRGIAEDASSRMSDLSGDISSITEAVTQATGKVRETESLVGDIHETGAGLGHAIDSVAEKASASAVQSREIMERAKSLYETSVDSKKQADSVYQGTKDRLSRAIEDSRRVHEINSLAEDILSISSQTNLLALNASIEAARAGEAGKGFSVVADEIRVLADNSKQAVDKIQEVTETIIKSVDNLSQNSQELLQFMNGKVSDDYQNMIEISEQYEKDAIFYSEVSDDLGASSQQMSSSMTGINESIAQIVELIDSVVQQMKNVEEAAGLSKEGSAEVQAKMEKLFQTSQSLNRTVAGFKV